MYCHIVPQVYQKSWHSKNGKSNVFYFDKNNLRKSLDENGGNANNNLGVENYYILEQKDFDNGIDFTNIKRIENELDHKIENYWKSVLKIVNKLTLQAEASKSSKAFCLEKNNSNDTIKMCNNLLNFVILQLIRNKNNFKDLENGKISEILKECKTYYEQTYNVKVEDLSNNEEFYDSIWKNLLIKSLNNDPNSLLNVLKDKIKDFPILIFYSKENELILSDNPILFNISRKKFKNLESAIYFPISPKILIVLPNFLDYIRSDNIILAELNSNFSKYINFLLKENSFECVGSDTNEIISKITEDFDFNRDWMSMIKNL